MGQDGAKMGQYGGKMEPHWRFGGLREALERLREALGGQRKRRKKDSRRKKKAEQKKSIYTNSRSTASAAPYYIRLDYIIEYIEDNL